MRNKRKADQKRVTAKRDTVHSFLGKAFLVLRRFPTSVLNRIADERGYFIDLIGKALREVNLTNPGCPMAGTFHEFPGGCQESGNEAITQEFCANINEKLWDAPKGYRKSG
jgi:hypothetical protein